jgi:hypothetical protein
MDGICRDCNGDGVMPTETGNRSTRAPYAPTMTERYCDCAAGRAFIGEHFGPHYPDAEKVDRAIEEHTAKMLAEGYQRCGGDLWCGEWVTKEERLCDRCRDIFHD